MTSRQRTWAILIAILILILLALNFLNFRAAQSATEVDHNLSTYRTGQTLPDSMAPGFTLNYAIRGEQATVEALTEALQDELEALPNIGAATPLTLDRAQTRGAPFLLVDLTSDRLWTPFYARATLTAQIYYAYDGDAPWSLDEPVVFDISPAVKADGEFTVTDRTMGLISRPAYHQHLAQSLASDIAAALQNDVFSRPPGTP